MSTLEINKIIAAFLTTGVVASFSHFLATAIMHPHEIEKPVYVVAGATQEAAPAEAAAKPAASLADLLASANAADGEKVARKCAACHNLEKGAPNKIGPHLWDVVGRPIASIGDFSYSDALKSKSGETWTFENLNAFLTKPKDFAPGTKMTFAGIGKPDERANLLLYLRSLSDSPQPLPK